MASIGIRECLTRLSMEPPIRLFTKGLLSRVRASIWTRKLWELSERPDYLCGLVASAFLARDQGIQDIIAIEFGGAGGEGLLTLQREAEAVKQEIGVAIKVVGFDSGRGLPELTGDYRDHPDYWKEGFPDR